MYLGATVSGTPTWGFLFVIIACPATHTAVSDGNSSERGKRHIFFSWKAAFRIASNGSHQAVNESPHRITATGTEINGTLDTRDFFPRGLNAGSDQHIITASRTIKNATENGTLGRFRRDTQQERDAALREAKADHDRQIEGSEHNDEDEFEVSPEMKVKIYTGVILGTVFLIIFVMCIWPLFKCCRTCCQVGTTGILACWDLCHCRDPGYRIMCLAAKQAGLDPPTPEEYDRFMSGWEEQAPELMEALMQ